MYLMQRATGRYAIVQCVWVYEGPIDFDGLRRFHRNLGRGLLGRRIERSPLPFARHRWVSDPGPADIDVAELARPRAELGDWLDERAQLRIDPERGPGWHLGVLPTTDGSTVVSLVASHCLIDGLGVVSAVAEAVLGTDRELCYPPPRSRTRRRALLQDGRETAKGAPGLARVVAEAARAARHNSKGEARPAPARPAAVDGIATAESIVVPAITVHVDVSEWDARAAALGGNGHHLAAGYAVRLAERMGRTRPADGAVTLQIPLTDRTPSDTCANMLAFVSVNVDPAGITTDLSGARAAIRRAFERHRESPEPVSPLVPLAPFAPKRVLKKVTEAAFAYADLPVAFSSMGEMPPIAACVDGTEPAYCFGRGAIQGALRRDLERARGELALFLLRIGGKVCITVDAYRPRGDNSKPALRELAAHALSDFGLTGVIG